MKKFIIAFLIMLASIGATARDRQNGVRLERLNSVISEYRHSEGFDVVNVGRFGTYCIKTLVRFGAFMDSDEDTKAFYNLVRNVKKFAVVDYGECAPYVKDEFSGKVANILSDEYLIMEVKDDGDLVKIYGVVDDKTDKLSNFVLSVPSDGTLICLFGSIPMSALSSVMD